MKYQKVSEYAKDNGLCYRTVYNMCKRNQLPHKQLPTGTILIRVENEKVTSNPKKLAIYCRESSSENKVALNNQETRLISYCNANGWSVNLVVKEIGSGLNDSRKKFLKLLEDDTITHIVVEHKDRFARFGLVPIKLLLEKQGRSLIVVNDAQDDKEDLIQDFISIITSFCARIYGRRRTKKATEKLIQELQN